MSETELGKLYTAQGLNPKGDQSIRGPIIGVYFLVILANYGILLYILLEVYHKDNGIFKTLLTNQGLQKRNRKNATTIIGNVASSVILFLGCLVVLMTNLSLDGRFALYFVACFSAFFGSVFQFFEVLVTPELRKLVLMKWLF